MGPAIFDPIESKRMRWSVWSDTDRVRQNGCKRALWLTCGCGGVEHLCSTRFLVPTALKSGSARGSWGRRDSGGDGDAATIKVLDGRMTVPFRDLAAIVAVEDRFVPCEWPCPPEGLLMDAIRMALERGAARREQRRAVSESWLGGQGDSPDAPVTAVVGLLAACVVLWTILLTWIAFCSEEQSWCGSAHRVCGYENAAAATRTVDSAAAGNGRSGCNCWGWAMSSAVIIYLSRHAVAASIRAARRRSARELAAVVGRATQDFLGAHWKQRRGRWGSKMCAGVLVCTLLALQVSVVGGVLSATGASRVNGPGAVAVSVTVFGLDFGTDDTTTRARIGYAPILIRAAE